VLDAPDGWKAMLLTAPSCDASRCSIWLVRVSQSCTVASAPGQTGTKCPILHVLFRVSHSCTVASAPVPNRDHMSYSACQVQATLSYSHFSDAS
jgi:hypothetical protein